MRIFDGKVYRDMTTEELAEIHEATAKAEAEEKHRPFTTEEVTAVLIKAQINTIAVDDQTALRMRAYYPEWAVGMAYDAGYKVQYGDKLYKVIMAHTSQESWTPDVATTLYEVINEQHDGTKYDPIPYDGNMALENGKYYTQGDVMYVCIRDTVNPVYNALADLVGVFVETTV
jgi:hypothetical protein